MVIVGWSVMPAPCGTRDIANSLLWMNEQVGSLPRWPLANIETGCMTGYATLSVNATIWRVILTLGLGPLFPSSHGIVSFSEALLKGLSGVNLTEAYAVVKKDLEGQDGEASSFISCNIAPFPLSVPIHLIARSWRPVLHTGLVCSGGRG